MLAPDHKGMKVDYTGMLGEAARLLRIRGNTASAFMLGEFQKHLAEMGERFYAGDVSAVDEFMQLYCIARERRPTAGVKTGGEGQQ